MKSVRVILIYLICSFTYAQISFDEQSLTLGVNINSDNIVLGAGISFVDFDNDGWDDITVSSPLRFYKNFSGTFLQVFPIIPVIDYQTKSVTWVDIDNDGDKDLFVTSDTDGNRLYENNGNFTFQNITATSGLPQSNLYTYGASWGEIDNDGYLDVFISNRIVSGNTISNYLYKNNGDGTFTDVTSTSGIAIAYELTFCSGFFDYDNDGWQDIYIANDKNFANILYRNNGNGTYTDVSASSGTGIAIDAMSVTVDDFNSDGYFDVYVTNTYFPISNPGGNVFYRNNGDSTFTNIATSSGTLFDSFAWGSVFLDADNDTDLDLHVSGSFDGTTPGFASTLFYENMGSETFVNPANSGFEMDQQSSYGNAIGDIDNDGRSDIIVYNNSFRPSIYKNTTTNSNNYLAITLTGTVSNQDGIGSVIEISINGQKQYRYMMCGEGYLSQNSQKEIFGLGSETEVDYVKVNWLSGIEDILLNVTSNQVINIIEGSTLSTDDVDVQQLSIHPNPFSDTITVTSTKENSYQIDIINILGQKIYSQVHQTVDNKITINTKTLPQGLYVLMLSDNTTRTVLKTLKK